MSSDFGVMTEESDVSAEVQSGWDIDTVSEVKEAISL